jgi:hypothetical protein
MPLSSRHFASSRIDDRRRPEARSLHRELYAARLVVPFIDLRTQPRNMHLDHVGLRIEMIIPNMLKQHGPCHRLARVLHEIFEQAELSRL